jgi:hypothetical protein
MNARSQSEVILPDIVKDGLQNVCIVPVSSKGQLRQSANWLDDEVWQPFKP